jgi:CheY-like chemotaxis protein
MMLEDFLETLGHTVVASCDSVEEALGHVEAGGFEVAILDVSLKDGKHVWPVADRLAASGTPFVLATGGHVDPPPPAHAAAPVLAKPYTIDSIEPALDRACGG